MKKLLPLSLLLVGAIGSATMFADADCDAKGITSDVSGHTFFKVRPPFQAASPEQVSLFRGRWMARECGIGGAIQLVPFGGQSTDDKGLARYFMFNGKSELGVNSLQPLGTLPADINPQNFGVIYRDANGNIVEYDSTIKFRPRQTYAGVGFEWRNYIGLGDCCDRGWWADISFPFEWVKNSVRLEESTPTIAAGAVLDDGAAGNMVSAFAGAATIWQNGEAMQYGLIPTGSDNNAKGLTKAGVADIEVKFGYDYVCSECCYANGYVGVIIPTGNKPQAIYMFEPIIGNNFHAGIMTGGLLQYRMWRGDCDRELWFNFNLNNRYLFANTQTRSFDLLNRPWSRYLTIYADAAAAAATEISPGINTFTQKVTVSPRYIHNFTSALVYNQGGFRGEIGYNFWARQSERVRLKNPWVEGPVVADLTALNLAGDGRVNLLSNIGNNNTNEAGINTPAQSGFAYSDALNIKVCDIDINSAAHPGAMSHTVYGALAYCWDACSFPMFVGVGGSYEFTGVNTALNRWMAWGKFSISI